VSRSLTTEQRASSNRRAKRWRKKQLKERPAEFRKYNADRAKELYNKNPEIAKKQQANFKNSYNNNPEFRGKVIRSASVGRYGMTPEKYDKQLREQNYHCALCAEKEGDAGRRLHIDHNHACCSVGPPKGRTCGECNRGLLCGTCNRALAALENLLKEAEIVPKPGTWTHRAMQYLRSYEVNLSTPWRTQETQKC
jgi:Recombination endonuclease VII